MENWCTLREDFQIVLDKVAACGIVDWEGITRVFKREVRGWEGANCTPDTKLKQIEAQMLILNGSDPGSYDWEEDARLQKEHAKYLLMLEVYWHQRSRVKWTMFGDKNSKFFHAMAVTCKRRNTIKTLQLANGEWTSEEKVIRDAFVSHYRAIYTKSSILQVHQVYFDLIQHLPQVDPIWHAHLDSIPLQLEIVAALATLGPNKAPGPDGFSAKLIQENWEVFGPPILTEVQQFFLTGQLSDRVSRSNLILILKTEEASRVEQYRPISVCNLVCKIISKLLALRIKPLLGKCISRAQGEFLQGRDIAQNVILLREVLHSFKQKAYDKKEFCMKVDLSKAFDRMDWEYIETLLPLYGFPSRISGWIMACVKSAKFSVVVNGRGDGFLTPQCGLRQGCSLSPYLFILGMDLLSRSLQAKVDGGLIKGIRLAPTSPPLTNCLYADDLLIFGQASCVEAQHIMSTIKDFMDVSSQRVGPAKSSVWFSNSTDLVRKSMVAYILQVPLEADPGQYLGAPVTCTRDSFQFLITRVSDKLQTWKCSILSQAGRITLIKSVILALPVYYMATTKIPVGVINAINALIRRFFWGKMDKERYLAYVAWAKVAAPIEEGGLGFLDLATMNEAMLLKTLWRLASNSDQQWVEIMRAKYIPKSLLWQSKRTYTARGCGAP